MSAPNAEPSFTEDQLREAYERGYREATEAEIDRRIQFNYRQGYCQGFKKGQERMRTRIFEDKAAKDNYHQIKCVERGEKDFPVEDVK